MKMIGWVLIATSVPLLILTFPGSPGTIPMLLPLGVGIWLVTKKKKVKI